MPTALPAIEVPDYAPTLNAYRIGAQDKVANDKRALMKEAGGLAAAGNYKGAMSKLYSGGEFDEARGVSGEMRAQSAEGRAAASHARAMANDALERQAKGHELFGRLIPAIGNDPQKLEMAKSLLKQRGFDFSNVTVDQLPMLYQENISIADKLKQEMQQRELDAAKLKADQAQKNWQDDYNLKKRVVDAKAKKGYTPTDIDKKAILETDDTISANKAAISNLERAIELGEDSYSTPGASARARVGSVFGSKKAKNTQLLENLLKEQALTQLKAIFGGTPTEGEREILLQIQGSVDQPVSVRREIWERARDMAANRLKLNQEKSKALRSGTYFSAPASDMSDDELKALFSSE